MALGTPIQLRLTPAKQFAYEDEAQRQGKPLSTYLRERLEAQDAARAELDALRQEVVHGFHAMRQELTEAAETGGTAQAFSQDNSALLLEAMLLLRQMAGPERMKWAQGELNRQGMKPWTPN